MVMFLWRALTQACVPYVRDAVFSTGKYNSDNNGIFPVFVHQK